jgi:hypothetical protein
MKDKWRDVIFAAILAAVAAVDTRLEMSWLSVGLELAERPT